jgi:hypothetical protein
MPRPEADPQSPAEERLLDYLEVLREHPPEPSADIGAAVVRTARWQGAVRPYLGLAGALLGAFAAAAPTLVEPRRR